MIYQITSFDNQIFVTVPAKFPNNANILYVCTSLNYTEHKTF